MGPRSMKNEFTWCPEPVLNISDAGMCGIETLLGAFGLLLGAIPFLMLLLGAAILISIIVESIQKKKK